MMFSKEELKWVWMILETFDYELCKKVRREYEEFNEESREIVDLVHIIREIREEVLTG